MHGFVEPKSATLLALLTCESLLTTHTSKWNLLSGAYMFHSWCRWLNRINKGKKGPPAEILEHRLLRRNYDDGTLPHQYEHYMNKFYKATGTAMPAVVKLESTPFDSQGSAA